MKIPSVVPLIKSDRKDKITANTDVAVQPTAKATGKSPLPFLDSWMKYIEKVKIAKITENNNPE